MRIMIAALFGHSDLNTGIVRHKISLIDAVGITFKAALEFAGTIDKVPKELDRLVQHLETIHIILGELHAIHSKFVSHELARTALSVLPYTLSTTETLIARLARSCTKLKGKNGLRNRLQFAFLDKDAIEKLSNNLQADIEKLKLLLQILTIQVQMQGQTFVLKKMEELMNMKNIGMQRDDSPVTPGSGRSTLEPEGSSSRFLSHWKSAVKFPGLQLSIVSRQREACSDYAVSLRLDVPCVDYAFLLAASLRKYPLCTSISVLPGSGIGFSRVLRDDSKFMVACREGNLFEVEDLCRKGHGRPDDISDENMTPLLYAAQGSNDKVVRFLLDNSANVN